MAKKTTTKNAVKKVAAKKATKTTATKAVKTAPAKAPAKKAVAKKAPAKASTVRQSSPQAGSAQEKAAKTAPAKASASSTQGKTVKTSIIARVDVGFGNSLYIRGEGAGLSWDQGIQLDNVSPYEWTFSTTKAKGDLNFKFLINDETWAEGDNLTVAKGGTSISSPVFAW